MSTEVFVKLPKHVLSMKPLGSTAKLVYAAVVDRIGKNENSWPGERRIADDIGSTRQAVGRAVADLERAGLLVVERGAGPRGSHRYRLPTSNDSLPVAKRNMPQNMAITGKKSCHVPVTKRGHNETKEPDPVTRPSMGGHMPDDPTGHVVNGVRYGLFDDQGAQPVSANGKANRSTRPRDPDPIWETVVKLFNLPVATKGQRSRVGKIVSELKAMDATPEEIRTRADRYRRAWPSVAFTPEALSRHWSTFCMEQPTGRQQPSNPARVRAPADKYTGVGVQC